MFLSSRLHVLTGIAHADRPLQLRHSRENTTSRCQLLPPPAMPSRSSSWESAGGRAGLDEVDESPSDSEPPTTQPVPDREPPVPAEGDLLRVTDTSVEVDGTVVIWLRHSVSGVIMRVLVREWWLPWRGYLDA